MTANCKYLYDAAYRLIHLGEDGSPVYTDELMGLNEEVLKRSDELLQMHGATPEEEAEICISLLMGYSGVISLSNEVEEKKQLVLDRAGKVLEKLDNGALRCKLLLECYAVAGMEELLEEVKRVVDGWKGKGVTEEEKGVMEEYIKNSL